MQIPSENAPELRALTAGTTSLAEAFEHEQTSNELHLLHGVKLEIAVGFCGAIFVLSSVITDAVSREPDNDEMPVKLEGSGSSLTTETFDSATCW